MKRKVYVKQMNQKAASAKAAKPDTKANEVNRDQRTECSPTQERQRPRSTATEPAAALPGVTVLIKGSQATDESCPPLVSATVPRDPPVPAVAIEEQSAATPGIQDRGMAEHSESSTDNSDVASTDSERQKYVYHPHESQVYNQSEVVQPAIEESAYATYYTSHVTVDPHSKDPTYHQVSPRRVCAPQDGYTPLTYTSLQTASQMEPPLHAEHEEDMAYAQHTWDQENAHYPNYTNWKYLEDYHEPHHGLTIQNTNSAPHGQVSASNHLSHQAVVENGQRRDNSRRVGTTSQSGVSRSSSRRRRKRMQTPVQRSAANMRERRRMCHLNVAFDVLKDRLPNVKDKKKLSRIQTLKAAIYYIHLLRDSLNLS